MHQDSDDEIQEESLCELWHAVEYVILEEVKLFLG
jgi:hypothetical protein